MITSIENALVVDDDVLMREFVIETLERSGMTVTQAGRGTEAKKLLEERELDLAFVVLKMRGEAATTGISKERRDKGREENGDVGRKGGFAAKKCAFRK